LETEFSIRDSLGRFTKNYKETPEEHSKRMEAIRRHYDNVLTVCRLREQNPRIFNSWRAMWYTEKGKKAGCSEESWKEYKNFYNDVSPTYSNGLSFHRIDINSPFSKDNFVWITNAEAKLLDTKNTITLTYNKETLTLKEFAVKYNQPVAAIRGRYHKHKDVYSTEEIIFGRKTKRGYKEVKDAIPGSYQERAKASKMISSYKCKDKKHGLDICDITIDWMIENIMHKPCVYCGDTHRIGCDRVDNNKGHTKDNVVPCCYECNTVRNNNFTYEEMKILGKTIKEIKSNRIKEE